MTSGDTRRTLPLSAEKGARSMSDVLHDRRVAILATDGVERVELEQPRQAVEGAGAQVELLSIHDVDPVAALCHELDPAVTALRQLSFEPSERRVGSERADVAGRA